MSAQRKDAAEAHNLPLWRTAWRRMRRRPFQYVLFILGVALGVAMIVSIDLANGAASRAFQLSTSAITGRATHRIVGGPGGVDEALYRRLVVELGYQPAAPVVEGYVLGETLGNQPLRLIGVDPFAEPPFRNYLQTQATDETDGLTGLIPFLSEPDTIVIARDLAESYGVALGETVPLSVGGRTVTVRVVGLLQPADDASRRSLRDIIFTDVATAQELLDMVGSLSHVDLMAADEEALAPVRALLPEGVRVEPAAAQSNAIQQMTAAFELNLTALSLLALVVGMFLIYNTVTFSVVQRRRLFGILRALGVTGGQLFRLILAEAVLLSLVGSLLGLVLGVVLGRGMVRLVTQTINDFYFVINVRDVPLPPATLIRGLFIGVLAAVFASLLPALEAMRTSPQSTLRRSTLESRTQRLVPWLVVAWLVLGSAGALLLWLEEAGLLVTFTGLFAVLIAFALLTAPLTVLLMRLLAPLLDRLFGTIGRLAPRDIVRSLSRTSVAIAALMTAVSVIVGVSIMIDSFRSTVTVWLGQTLRADVYLSAPALTASRTAGLLPADVAETAAAWAGIEEAVAVRSSATLVPDLGREVDLAAVDGDISAGQRDYAWVQGDPETLWARFGAGEGIFISEPLLLREDLPIPPPPLTLMTAEGPRTFPVLAVVYDYASDQGTVMIDRDLFTALYNDDRVSSMGLFLAPGVEPDEVVAELEAAFAGREDVVVQSNAGVRGNALDIFDRTFAITAALQLLATLVAFIGVLSALMSLQLERARELGVLRATGMTLRQLWQMTLLETGLMGGTAGLLAMPTGYILAWILIYVINVRSFGWTLQMSLAPEHFLQAFAVALVAALLAGVYPALRLGNMVIASAIRQE
ncbi:MAG: FtsX-like permease family protein [Candidatus Promineifilaceae bacterium]|nr:FtsX-like permease family protein [Candidatus Promineifilaceae bacterium]